MIAIILAAIKTIPLKFILAALLASGAAFSAYRYVGMARDLEASEALIESQDAALKQMATERQALEKALAERRTRYNELEAVHTTTQRRLNDALESTASAAAWGRSPVPSSVLDILRPHPTKGDGTLSPQ